MKLTYQRNYIQSYIENLLTNIIYVCIISINCSINAHYLIFMYHISIAVFDRQFWTTNAFISRIPLCTLNTHLKHMHIQHGRHIWRMLHQAQNLSISLSLSHYLSLSLAIYLWWNRLGLSVPEVVVSASSKPPTLDVYLCARMCCVLCGNIHLYICQHARACAHLNCKCH